MSQVKIAASDTSAGSTLFQWYPKITHIKRQTYYEHARSQSPLNLFDKPYIPIFSEIFNMLTYPFLSREHHYSYEHGGRVTSWAERRYDKCTTSRALVRDDGKILSAIDVRPRDCVSEHRARVVNGYLRGVTSCGYKYDAESMAPDVK
ncbi:MAG: hypothetical protein Faunusvirus4_5 [Faunusvirus sp.]|uniref:Uncharacterized protein n=1 Tax=Faunusvirus sp. TaxID=2487766 RepID=A0A3G4ZXX1_9VIRU|nr:MAG: hypothetical protein Faunusvirus4_5 [Faunusvirus sp.]